jgi:hypothetical protein
MALCFLVVLSKAAARTSILFLRIIFVIFAIVVCIPIGAVYFETFSVHWMDVASVLQSETRELFFNDTTILSKETEKEQNPSTLLLTVAWTILRSLWTTKLMVQFMSIPGPQTFLMKLAFFGMNFVYGDTLLLMFLLSNVIAVSFPRAPPALDYKEKSMTMASKEQPSEDQTQVLVPYNNYNSVSDEPTSHPQNKFDSMLEEEMSVEDNQDTIIAQQQKNKGSIQVTFKEGDDILGSVVGNLYSPERSIPNKVHPKLHKVLSEHPSLKTSWLMVSTDPKLSNDENVHHISQKVVKLSKALFEFEQDLGRKLKDHEVKHLIKDDIEINRQEKKASKSAS